MHASSHFMQTGMAAYALWQAGVLRPNSCGLRDYDSEMDPPSCEIGTRDTSGEYRSDGKWPRSPPVNACPLTTEVVLL